MMPVVRRRIVNESAEQEISQDGMLTVSVAWLERGFKDDVVDAGLEWDYVTIRDILDNVILETSKNVICPERRRVGSSYAQGVALRDPSNTGQANHMLSYTWGYKCKDIVDALSQWCKYSKKDPKTTFVWMCAICINQHQVKDDAEVSFDHFRNIFEGRIREICHVLGLLAPWKDPGNLTRVWCVFELHMCIKLENEGVKLEFIMPPSECSDFKKIMLTPDGDGLHEIIKPFFNAIFKIDITKAKASNQADRNHILRLCETYGNNKINASVKEKLQNWFISQANNMIKESSGPKICLRVGLLLSELNSLDSAEKILKYALAKDNSKDCDVNTALLVWHELAWIEHRRKEYDTAVKHIKSGLDLYHRHCAEKYSGTLIGSCINCSKHFPEEKSTGLILAKLYRCLARALIRDCAFSKKEPQVICNGESNYLRAAELMEHYDGEECIDGAKLYNNLGLCYTMKEDYKEAMRYYDKAKEVLNRTDNLNSRSDIGRLFNVACMHLKQGWQDHDSNERNIEAFNALKQMAKLSIQYNEVTRLLQISKLLGSYRNIMHSYDKVDCMFNVDCKRLRQAGDLNEGKVEAFKTFRKLAELAFKDNEEQMLIAIARELSGQ